MDELFVGQVGLNLSHPSPQLPSTGLCYFVHIWLWVWLIREFPLPCVVRLWDTYIAEGDEGFPVFHVYVCAVFLIFWSAQMRTMDFQELMLFMQKFPTESWTNQQMETLLAEA
eukprot:GHVN01055084.1.p2 GENE.GHVN01055084.1~~GHVN01055084.1.p2  ORF type:complete len:113 (+),score=8.90 GHVN01055084.1:1469-1807(+)